MKQVDTLIIGAGISGLTYANFCRDSYLLIEKDIRPGGLCRTFYEGTDYIWDYAGHFFHFTKEKIKTFFEEKIGKDNMVRCKKNTKVYYKGDLIDYPFQKNIHQLPKEEFIDCLYDLFYRGEESGINNFEDMLYRRFGKSITEKFLKPYNKKLYACDLNTLDKDAMGRFFPYADIKEIIYNMKHSNDESYNQYFDYPKKGAQVFVDALLDAIPQECMILGTEIQKIDLDRHIAILSDHSQIQYQKLISTIPLTSFIKIAYSHRQQTDISKLHSNKVLVFNLGFDKKSVFREHWIYFPEKIYNFYRVGFYDNILSSNKLSMYVEIGYGSNCHIDIQKELLKTLSGLKHCGIILDHKLCTYNCLLIEPAYVHITSESKRYVNDILKNLESIGAYSIGRYGSWTYCSIEDCMLQAIQLASPDWLNK